MKHRAVNYPNRWLADGSLVHLSNYVYVVFFVLHVAYNEKKEEA
ncbi:hypothetical protein [Paenibacillus sp. Soil766]|nr:hypothetical protein [Paenibacillus sp. Soil766]